MIGEMIKEVYAIMCPYCKDVYAYYPKNSKEDIEFLYNYTDCWSCKREYAPSIKILKMDDFVFRALKTVKM